MKSRFSVILILLPLSIVAMAQPRLSEPKYQFGVVGGVEASMTQFKPSVKQTATSPQLGGTAGFIFRYLGHKYCALQLELEWMRRGWHEDTGYIRQFDYLNLPFMAHIYFGDRFRGYINLGPEIGYCLNSTAKSQPSDYGPQYADIDNRFYWGVCGGLGMYGRTVAGCWQLEARFGYGLGTYFSNRATAYFSNSNPMTLSLNVAWLWEK